MSIFDRFRKEKIPTPVEIEREKEERAIKGINALLEELYEALGLGIYVETNDIDELRKRISRVFGGVVSLKDNYVATAVIQLIREGKKVPKWMQNLLKSELQLRTFFGEPEEVSP